MYFIMTDRLVIIKYISLNLSRKNYSISEGHNLSGHEKVIIVKIYIPLINKGAKASFSFQKDNIYSPDR